MWGSTEIVEDTDLGVYHERCQKEYGMTHVYMVMCVTILTTYVGWPQQVDSDDMFESKK